MEIYVAVHSRNLKYFWNYIFFISQLYASNKKTQIKKQPNVVTI
jgi:hypothetical protein